MAHINFQSMLLTLVSYSWTFDTNYSVAYATSPSNSSAIYFGLMLSLSGDDQSSGALAGVQAALDEINSRDDLLPGYSLHYTPIDSVCDRTTAWSNLFSQLFQAPSPMVALIGSGCSAANDATTEISHYFNITHISCTSSFSEVDDHKDNFQLLPSEVNLARVFYSIIKEYGWRRVALIVQNQPRFKQMIYSLLSLLSNSTTIYSQLYFDDDEAHFGQITFDPQYRIYVLAMESRLVRRILCKAHRLGIHYPKYAFLTYGTYEPQWWISQSDDECSSDDIAYTLQYSLAVSHFNSSMRDNDNNILFYHVCYDAVFSLAYALEKVAENEQINTSMGNKILCQHMDNAYSGNISSLINEQLRNTSFIGDSGPVRFDENGIRCVTELRVLQYRTRHINGTPLHREGHLSQRLKLIDVAYVKRENTKSLEFIVGSKDDIWPGQIPHDGEPREDFVTILAPVAVILSILNISGIIYAVVCFIFNAIFHKKRVIRIDSPNLNYLIITGATLVYFSCIVFVVPAVNPSAVSALCILRIWVVTLGYTTMYGSIIAKLWRIYTIFSNPKIIKNKKGIKDCHLMLIVLSLTLIDIIILVTYTIAEGALTHFSAGMVINKERPSGIHGELEIETVYKVYTCSTNSWIRQISIGLLYFYKFFLYVCALYFAFRLRNIKMKGLNDAKYIAGFVYTTSVLIAITFISSVTLSEYIDVYAIIHSFGFWLANSSMLGLLFVPKMIRYYRDPNGTLVLSSNDKTLANQNGIGKLPKLESSDMDGLKQRVKELEDLLNKHNIPWNKCEDA